ncbi:hypothetical protein BLA24_10845 [Streptomyces cinnamoneus]|uniref:Uncharacterized protein n=1 Tax=Streptomyces cinnamoneus TaxID=53446 RepID=A0A2G1XL34_STRCJ|nr:hypothetical protein BLA24_10845 [Streptomyces cinnamoneus]
MLLRDHGGVFSPTAVQLHRISAENSAGGQGGRPAALRPVLLGLAEPGRSLTARREASPEGGRPVDVGERSRRQVPLRGDPDR